MESSNIKKSVHLLLKDGYDYAKQAFLNIVHLIGYYAIT